MSNARLAGFVVALIMVPSTFATPSFAQTEDAIISGRVADQTGAVIPGATVRLLSAERGTIQETITTRGGIYLFPTVHPGIYHITVRKEGFHQVDYVGLTANVQAHIEQNFKLEVGSVSESVTVEGGVPLVNTEAAAVSTVVDRQFAENLPMNGRSFQTLIELAPGVVVVTSSFASDGQFSVNGQRADSNYWIIDGVSANIGMSSSSAASDTLAGALGGFSAQGGTNSLVSVDALQEFRIQTSTFAPEFGRTPGGQISIVTRSGANQFHGTLFDYFRNDALDANNWFNGFINFNNPSPLPKAEERQNNFGGTFSGPISKNRTFFFFSYEGMRLRLPQTALSAVPDASYTPGTTNSRQNAIPAMQPFINAFPLPSPNSPEIPCDPTIFGCPSSGLTGSAALNASYSNRSSLDAASLRLDDRASDKLTLFGRYNYSPSSLIERPGPLAAVPLSQIESFRIPTQTSTLGATWIVSPTLTNDLRVNYSRVDSSSAYMLDNFGGAVPFLSSAAGLPNPYTNQDSEINLYILGLSTLLFSGNGKTTQTQRQFNVVDSVTRQSGPHSFKFGADYRRLMPSVASPAYVQGVTFADLPDMDTGTLSDAIVYSTNRVPLVLQNFDLFAQDTWRVLPRLTLTYGLRWNVDFSPRTSSGPSLPAVANFNNLATLGVAPQGTPVFNTQYSNIAPRIGVAYQLSQKKGWKSVLRGGWGLFYDLATTQLQVQGGSFYPFGSTNVVFGQYPLDPTSPTGGLPAPITSSNATLDALDPQLKAPYTQEWNLAFEQSIGPAQSFSATYTGAAGRRLLISEAYTAPNPNISSAILVGNYGNSDYDALQLEFRRRLENGLQVLASYNWAHSIDTGSTGAGGLTYGDFYSRQLAANSNRGPSDFDIRNSASAALTYDIPSIRQNRWAKALSQGWSTQNTLQARSATPVDVSFLPFTYVIGPSPLVVRPDVVTGQPFYLNAAQCPAVLFTPCPGGKGLNPAAFTNPPLDSTGQPTRQGDIGRNRLRGFGVWQWDFALHRDFRLYEQVKLQFRAEFFNVLNHPNFGPLDGGLAPPYFGWSNQTLGQSLNATNDGGGGFTALYQMGGPRSIQLALKLEF